MSAGFGEVGGRGYMSDLGVEGKGDSGAWIVLSAEGWGGVSGSQAAAEQVSNLFSL